ncbi:catalase family protein [Mycobacterium ulcerans str. Harvey]|uniref:Catalase family protein n=1 Tax=Mycobacterium ulcerans str. Harvey TaxID=1299332 RepID=A0ABP3AAH7_MYCUL|nr:catalase family protein [Mycobacterium ulcerans str. Harvey]
MGGSVTPDEAIEAIRGTGGACPGYRALHAKGTLYRGTFTATPEAAGLSRAKHFDGATVAALIRFSNGSGKPTQRDGAPGVRGMAVKFTLPDKSTTDVSMQTARLFTSSTPEGFVDVLKVLRPSLTTPARIAKYLVTHPRVLAALPILGAANRIPASYATCEYHGLHAFRWVAADGSARFVRYHMIPAVGEKFLSPLAAATRAATSSPTNCKPASPPGRCGSIFASKSPARGIRSSIRRCLGRVRRWSPSAPLTSLALTPNANTTAISSCSTRCG